MEAVTACLLECSFWFPANGERKFFRRTYTLPTICLKFLHNTALNDKNKWLQFGSIFLFYVNLAPDPVVYRFSTGGHKKKSRRASCQMHNLKKEAN